MSTQFDDRLSDLNQLLEETETMANRVLKGRRQKFKMHSMAQQVRDHCEKINQRLKEISEMIQKQGDKCPKAIRKCVRVNKRKLMHIQSIMAEAGESAF